MESLGDEDTLDEDIGRDLSIEWGLQWSEVARRLARGFGARVLDCFPFLIVLKKTWIMRVITKILKKGSYARLDPTRLVPDPRSLSDPTQPSHAAFQTRVMN